MTACLIPFRPLRFIALVALLVAIVAAGIAPAAVTTTGEVTPIPPANGGTASTQLIVGAGTDDTSTDLWGWVTINNGTALQYGTLIAGDNEGFFGEINVLGSSTPGSNARFTLSGQGSSSNPTVQIGNEGSGYLNLDRGALMTVTNNSGDMSIGLENTGVGFVTVEDQTTLLSVQRNLVVGQSGLGTLELRDQAQVRTLSTSRSNYISIGRDASGIGSVLVDSDSILRASGSLRVGESGIGSLTITNGGKVNVIDASTPLIPPFPPFMSIGANATGVGTVLVDGQDSRLLVRRELVVGGLGQGTLKIRNHGIVQILDNPLLVPTIEVGPYGRIELDGGTLMGSTPDPAPSPIFFGTTVNGYIGGSGLVRGTVEIGEDAFLEAKAGHLLTFDSAVSNQGATTINGGEIIFNKQFANNAAAGLTPPGRVSVENGGTVRFRELLTNNGVLSSAHGATNIHGEIDNPGNIVVARDTIATFHDRVTTTGTLTVKPGGNALFLTDLMFVGLSLVQLEVDSNEIEDNSSQISAGGVITLGGTLSVALQGGYEQLIGKPLELITASGGIVGAFDAIELPLIPNDLEVGLHYTPTGVMMEVQAIIAAPELPGDYNDDGRVDSADYTVWRDQLGSNVSLPNDDTPGVDNGDYDRWKAHFGQTAGAGSFNFGTPIIPEPSTFVLLLSALATFGRYRRR
jgi:T5SS/PEP-CTERM-associated repeat protein